MTTVETRSAIVLALLALLVSAVVATGPRATAAVSSCANTVPVFFGLHGMAEGPPTSKTVGLSPEIKGFDYEQNLISGRVLVYPVSYTVLTASVWDLLRSPATNAAELMAAVNNGESHLQSDLAAYTKGCSLAQDRVALVGYSMGAWVINKWMIDHPKEWKMIRAVVLYGDPCWINGTDEGLVRQDIDAGATAVSGCTRDGTYPYPAARSKVPFPMESWCAAGDPVAGCGFNGDLFSQVAAAVVCVFNDTSCPHNWYRVGGPAEAALRSGARFVVNRLVG
jgi:hypothetical protein